MTQAGNHGDKASMNPAIDEIRVMTSGAFTAPYLGLIRQLETLTTKKIVTAAASIGTGDSSIPSRLKRGEAVDNSEIL